MAKGYVIGRAMVTNPEQWAKYAAASTKVIQQYGGKPLVRGGKMDTGEGEGRPRNVVYEFESYDQARAYLFSPEYAEARKLRDGAGTIDLVCVEGV